MGIIYSFKIYCDGCNRTVEISGTTDFYSDVYVDSLEKDGWDYFDFEGSKEHPHWGELYLCPVCLEKAKKGEL